MNLNSFRDSEMELMLHRRLLVDDHWGVGEALNEMAFGKGLVARGKHYLLFDFDPNEAHRRTRLLANELYAQPLITFDVDENPKMDLPSSPKSSNMGLPENVNLLTLESVSRNKMTPEKNLYLVRFEHIFDLDEHPILAQPANVPLRNFIESYFESEIISIEEVTLGGNQLKDKALEKRFQWNGEQIYGEREQNLASTDYDEFDEIELNPMEIRSFQIELQ